MSRDAQTINDENFRTAAASLKENEPIWAMQIEMVVGHRVRLVLDFDSLGGRYERVQPFIHQGMAAVVEAFPRLMMDRETWGDFFEKVRHVTVAGAAADAACEATLDDGRLLVRVPLQMRDIRTPTHRVIDAFRLMIGLPALSMPEPEVEEEEVEEPAAVVPVDPYAYAAKFVLDLEAAMREKDLWPGEKPAGEVEVKGAFGSENMAFTQWLAWILIPRVQEIVETRGSFPGGSQVAAYATREFDGADADEVLDVLRRFDDVINGMSE